MKKTLSLILFTCLLISGGSVLSQAPEGINYQATVRNSSGNLLTSQSVTVIFAIKSVSASGTTVYQETQSVSTNSFGGFSAVIGSGTATTGTFASINWGSTNHFLNVKVNGNDLGTTQMMSVPYSLNANTANQLSSPMWKKRISNGDVFLTGEPVIIGDSAKNAEQLTVSDDFVTTELVDLIQTNGTIGADVINMDVTTSSVGQFLECHTNGNNKISLNTNGTVAIDSTLTIDEGEINRSQPTSANLVPIAYGYVTQNGTKSANGSTSNFTVSKTSTGGYDITIPGENYFFSDYTCVVTLSGSAAGFISNSSIGGKLRISTKNISGTATDRGFYFIVYKP